MSDIEIYDGTADLSISRPPEAILEEAKKAAVALAGVIKDTDAVVKIGKSIHLKAEAWQTLGHFYGLAARTPDEKTRYVQYGDVCGFEAGAELYHVATGRIVSEATSMCLNDEEKWGPRTKYEWRSGEGGRHRVAVGTEPTPLFQLRSMAQTRAISKVHSNALKWVVVLGGWSPTPAEDLERDGDAPQGDAPPKMPQSSGKLITEKQRKRMYAIGKNAGLSDEDIHNAIAQHGFEHSSQVTMDKYEEICGEMEATGV